MHSKDVALNGLDMSDMIIKLYTSDLSDADITIRPLEGMNPIAWQLGHLLSSERHFVDLVAPGASPALPPDFDAGHGKVVPTDSSHYLSLAQYQELWNAQRAVTRAVIEKQSDADMDRTDATFPSFASNVGTLLNMIGMHAMMHAGQFVAVRRKLGKPVVM